MHLSNKHTLSAGAAAIALLIPSSLSALSLDEIDTVVDVSFSYTQERQNNYGGSNQVLANMNQSLGITNTAHDNTGTGMFFNYIVLGGAINYNPSGQQSIVDLRAGNVPATVNRRNTSGADVMALNSEMSAAGLAYVGDPRQYAVKFLTGPASAHELGHTFGCGHGGEGASYSSGNGDRPYAGGWAYRDGSNVRRGTVMTGAQIMWYSTPQKTFNGQTTGIPNVKDCKRRIRETRRESSRQRDVRPEGGRSGGWWTISNVYSNLNIGLQSNNSNNGTRLVQKSGGDNWRQWRFDSAGVGGGWLTSRNRQTNKAIDMTGNSTDGRYIHQWSHNPGNQNQHLKLDHDDSGRVRIRFRNGNKVIHNHGRKSNDGNKLTQWNWQGGSHLQWYMKRNN